jgi:hypothetical protein
MNAAAVMTATRDGHVLFWKTSEIVLTYWKSVRARRKPLTGLGMFTTPVP